MTAHNTYFIGLGEHVALHAVANDPFLKGAIANSGHYRTATIEEWLKVCSADLHLRGLQQPAFLLDPDRYEHLLECERLIKQIQSCPSCRLGGCAQDFLPRASQTNPKQTGESENV